MFDRTPLDSIYTSYFAGSFGSPTCAARSVLNCVPTLMPGLIGMPLGGRELAISSTSTPGGGLRRLDS